MVFDMFGQGNLFGPQGLTPSPLSAAAAGGPLPPAAPAAPAAGGFAAPPSVAMGFPPAGPAERGVLGPTKALPGPSPEKSFGAKVKGFLGKDSTIRMMAALGAALSPEGSPMERLGKAVAAQTAMRGYTKYLNSLSDSIMKQFKNLGPEPETAAINPLEPPATGGGLGSLDKLGGGLNAVQGKFQGRPEQATSTVALGSGPAPWEF